MNQSPVQVAQKPVRQMRPAVAPIPIVADLEPYTGDWTFKQAAHLLRRTMLGPTIEQMQKALSDGLENTVDKLLRFSPLPNPPLNNNPQDPNVPLWQTWVDKAVPQGNPDAINKRRLSLRSWMMEVMLKEGISIREKMTIFWMNHFVVELFITRDPTFMYQHITLMREYAIGDFRELVKKATIDPSMLRYLNGNQNKKGAPNENFARELLELFTVGKGDLVGPGDYSTFTEQDVEQMAKALTGWKDVGFYKRTDNERTGSEFLPNRHDESNKQLSYHFNNEVITNKGAQEYAYLIDVILESPDVANFICEKLYRYFVYYEISDEVQECIIKPMARIFRSSNYQIKPVLDTLLKSQHFYESQFVGTMIKNPVDFILTTLKQFQVQLPNDKASQYFMYGKIYAELEDMQMELFDPPDVAGWKAYYQEPLFYRIWINSVTLPVRVTFSNTLTTVGFNQGAISVKVNVLDLVETVSDPSNPNKVVSEFALTMFPVSLPQSQKDALKNILIPGLPDFEWTIEYEDYKANPGNRELEASIERKLRDLVTAMVNMAEYYLS